MQLEDFMKNRISMLRSQSKIAGLSGQSLRYKAVILQELLEDWYAGNLVTDEEEKAKETYTNGG